MSVSEMKRLEAVTLGSREDELVKELTWLSCVEVEGEGVEREVINDKSEIGEALRVLKKYRKAKKGIPVRRTEVSRAEFDEKRTDRYERCKETVKAVKERVIRLGEIRMEEEKSRLRREGMRPWESCELKLGKKREGSVNIGYGIFPGKYEAEDIGAMIGEGGAVEAEIVSRENSAIYVVMYYRGEPEMGGSYTKIDMSEYGELTAREVIVETMERERELEAEESEIKVELERIAERETKELEYGYDRAILMEEEGEVRSKLSRTASTVRVRGWVPEGAMGAVIEKLEKSGCEYEFSEPEAGEEVPVMLKNVGIAEPFEGVVGLYSLPKYKTFDPTFIMSIFYFIIFGLMFGDVIYGIILSVGGLIAVKYVDMKAGMKRMVMMFGICGISSIISGVLFGSYFGDLPKVFMQLFGIEVGSPALWFDMVEEPMSFLIVSLAVGALHLAVGMGIKFYILSKAGKIKDAIYDIGSWYMVFGGIGIYFINELIGAVIVVTGVMMLILTQGRAEKNIFMKLIKGIMSLYNIVSYVSDLLSYSRIMALGLASAVIGSVVNILATIGGPTIIGFIVMPIVLIFGHVVNLAINLLGTFVHTSRLQYIEFFGKFYEDGGRGFKPATADFVYSRVE